MNNRKIIVTDLDGTLLDKNKKCSELTKNYLKELKDNGYIIAIATGRILDSAIYVTDGAEFVNYIIGDAGGLVYDIKNSKEIFKKNISSKDIKTICSYYNKYNKYIEHINICNLRYYYKYTTKEYQETQFGKNIVNLDDFLSNNTDIIHISIRINTNKIVDELCNKLKTNIPNLDFNIMQDSFSDEKWIEVSCENVSKYNGIKIISDLENISNNNIIAFGDGLNDIEMIEKCGVGVAMGNALQEVKDVANYITTSNNENGIVDFLQRHI